MTAAPCWVAFVASEDERAVATFERRVSGRVTRYHVEGSVPVRGEATTRLAPGWSMLRVEHDAPIPFPEDALPNRLTVFRGVTKHLFYTGRAQRDELNERSRGELGPSPETAAVLIPIAKAPAWWQLAQDQRQAHFERHGVHEGHTAIGLRYVDRVFRKLYHCRYSDAPGPYDFLTYFEFQKSHADDFKRLLAELRDPNRNPEWSFVTLEFEVWLTKLG